jgi:separase
MRTPISALYGPPTPKPATQTDVLAIPLPPSSTSLSETLQTLISTYLLHALVILSHKFQSQSHSQSQWQALSNTLQSTPTLLQWLPHLPSLQPKHKDSILTRAYSVLAKLPSSPSPSPSNHPASNSSSNSRTTFELRTYALHYLLHTSPGCIEPNTFWDQATKFCIVFVRSSSSHLPSTSNTRGQTEDEVVKAVLSAFGVLVSGVNAREDQGGWMRGRGFVGFCECWMGFAKRVSSFLFFAYIVRVEYATINN